MKSIYKISLFCFLAGGALASCTKSDFLDKKPNTSLVVPNTLEDFQRLLDGYIDLNYTPLLGEISSDNFYLLTYQSWETLPVHERNAYIWKADIFEGTGNIRDWNLLYKQVFYANIVLEGLSKIEVNNSNQIFWNKIKGWALFIRGHAFFNLSQLFCPPYDEATYEADLGIPIRTKSGVDEKSVRSSVKDTYTQIISDLLEAKDLLPNTVESDFRNRPSKAAALGLLARVYLTMRSYSEALGSASASLQIYDALIDYNSLSPTSFAPFTRNNVETIYQSEMGSGSRILAAIVSPNTIIDSTLYSSYSDDDLRKEIFFRLASGNPTRKTAYTGTINPFGGLATDEIYLIKAECLARSNDVAGAMSTLNTLLEKRFKSGTFADLTAGDSLEALNTILLERRKELVFRGLRWQDIRRLNKENANIVVTRVLNGQAFTLLPNSPLYILPIPPDEIRLSGLQQNQR